MIFPKNPHLCCLKSIEFPAFSLVWPRVFILCQGPKGINLFAAGRIALDCCQLNLWLKISCPCRVALKNLGNILGQINVHDGANLWWTVAGHQVTIPSSRGHERNRRGNKSEKIVESETWQCKSIICKCSLHRPLREFSILQKASQGQLKILRKKQLPCGRSLPWKEAEQLRRDTQQAIFSWCSCSSHLSRRDGRPPSAVASVTDDDLSLT